MEIYILIYIQKEKKNLHDLHVTTPMENCTASHMQKDQILPQHPDRTTIPNTVFTVS